MSTTTEAPARHTVAPAGAAAPRVSALGLVRVAGLPADLLELVGARVPALLDALADVEAELAQLAPRLVEGLFGLVPQLDDDTALRRQVLSGKRCVHQGRPLPWDAAVHAAVTARATSRCAADLAAWSSATGRRDGLLAELDDRLESDRSRAVARLYDALDDPHYRQALAVAAPVWLEHGQPQARRSDEPGAVRTLLSYASRACVKTSPFAGLTTVGVAGETGAGRARSRASALLAWTALQRLARDPVACRGLTFRVAASRPGGPLHPGGLLLQSRTVQAGGYVWRDDRVVSAEHARRWTQALQPDGAASLTGAQALDRVGGEDPVLRLQRLLDVGVLQPVAPWRRDEDPLRVLATTVPEGSAVPPAELAAVAALGEGLASAGATARTRAGATVREVTRRWSGAAAGGQEAALLYEDRETDLELPDLSAVDSVRADLVRLARDVRPRLFRSHVYDALLDAFVRRHGAGGSCDDLLGFLLPLVVDGDLPPMQAALAADARVREAPGERAWLPVGPTSAPPTAGVYYQVGATSLAEVRAGRHVTVVNQFGSGSGALLARFTGLLGPSFTDRLGAHVRTTWGAASCRELVVWTDCNTAQAQCAGVLPPLLAVGEPGGQGGLAVEDAVLVHDAGTDTLSLTDRSGQPFGLAYLGLTPQHLLQGYLGLLAVLADPWVNGSSASDASRTAWGASPALPRDAVVHVPRQVDGRLVTRRASWTVPVALLPGHDGRTTGSGLVLALDRLRREHAIPDEVFVTQVGSGSLSPTARKPAWCALASSVAVSALYQSVRAETTHLRLVEALPTRALHPLRDRDGRRRASEQVAMLSWERPGVSP